MRLDQEKKDAVKKELEHYLVLHSSFATSILDDEEDNVDDDIGRV